MSNLTHPLLGVVLVAIGSIAFSAKAIMVKLAYAAGLELDAITLMTLRMGFALPFYIGMLWWLQRRARAAAVPRAPLTRQQRLALIGIGLAGYYLASLFDFWGLEYVTASLERLVLYLYPTLTILLAAALKRRLPRRDQMQTLGIGYLGILLVVIPDFRAGGADVLLGTALVFASALSYAVFLVGNAELVGRMGSRRFTAWSMLIATAGVFVHFLARGDFAALRQPAEVYAWGVALALISTVAASFLLNEGMRRLGAETTVLLSMIGPISTLALGAWALDERLSAPQWLGAALVMSGVVITGLRARRARAAR